MVLKPGKKPRSISRAATMDAPVATKVAEAPPTETRSLDERRRAIHEKAQQALGEMRPADADE